MNYLTLKPKDSKDTKAGYSRLRLKHLELNPVCVVCLEIYKVRHPATKVHHRRGRRFHLCDPNTFVSCCAEGEKWIHSHKEKSILRGFLATDSEFNQWEEK